VEDKVMIIMTSGPDTPKRCATPFFFASIAAAMDYDVTMFFTIDGTLLLKKGVAETVYPKAGGKSIKEFLDEALESGVKFTACTASTELNDIKLDDILPGVKMVGGAFMWQHAEECKTVLTF
jgi:uncharacterized protein